MLCSPLRAGSRCVMCLNDDCAVTEDCFNDTGGTSSHPPTNSASVSSSPALLIPKDQFLRPCWSASDVSDRRVPSTNLLVPDIDHTSYRRVRRHDNTIIVDDTSSATETPADAVAKFTFHQDSCPEVRRSTSPLDTIGHRQDDLEPFRLHESSSRSDINKNSSWNSTTPAVNGVVSPNSSTVQTRDSATSGRFHLSLLDVDPSGSSVGGGNSSSSGLVRSRSHPTPRQTLQHHQRHLAANNSNCDIEMFDPFPRVTSPLQADGLASLANTSKSILFGDPKSHRVD